MGGHSEGHYGVEITLRIGMFLVFTSVVLGTAACGDDSDTITCVVNLGTAQTSVPIDTKVGASSVVTVGSYSVMFSILDGGKLEAKASDEDSTLMTATTGDGAARGERLNRHT